MGPASLVPVVAAVSAWWAWPKLPIIDKIEDLRSAAGAIMGMDATMLGFLVSTGALLFAVAQTSLVRNLYRTGHVPRLLGALFLDAAWFLIALCIALACVVMNPATAECLRLLMAANVCALVALLPVAHAMWHLLLNAGPRDGPLEFK